MIHKVIALCKERDVTLTTYIHDQSEQGKFQIEKRPAIIIMPGGAYSFLSDTEGEPVALTFLKEGYNTFALRYSVGDDKYVPAINPIMIAGKMIEYDLPFELHLFQDGEHGMSVCNNLSSYNENAKNLNEANPNVSMWVPMCVNWINKLFHI